MTSIKSTVSLLFLTCLLTACGNKKKPQQSSPKSAITGKELAAHVKTLSSDAFAGREPGTPGGEKAVNYISKNLKKAGVSPGNKGSWFQNVPLMSIALKPNTPVTFKGLGQPKTLTSGENTVVWTKRMLDSVTLKNSEMVFVGYGVVAPEWGWNDYAGLDVKGKTVVILVNDPGFGTENDSLFNGKAMTYYGRWTYKYEEAARQGAAAAIIIHETKPAGYPWFVVSEGWSGPQYGMVPDNKNMNRVKVEGWITHQFADTLFQHIGMSYEAAKKAAMAPDFTPIPLEVNMSTSLQNTIKKTSSRNVVGIVKGSKRPEETVIYTAHWDHLGTHENMEGDNIFNGAIDNATGVAALLELAEKFASLKPAPERSIVFLAVTAEESGLLGSKYYVNHPIYPLSKTVADINMDALSPYGKTKDIVVVGYNMNDLQDYLERAAKTQGRFVVPEASPEKGGYFRSDHFSFAKKGVPALYTETGADYRKGGTARGDSLAKDYGSHRYHKPGDEYQKSWDFSGMVQDLNLLYQIGYKMAGSTDWPQWKKNTSFKNIRLQTAEQRQ